MALDCNYCRRAAFLRRDEYRPIDETAEAHMARAHPRGVTKEETEAQIERALHERERRIQDFLDGLAEIVAKRLVAEWRSPGR